MRDMFEPNLTLSKEPDGEHTLHSVTITPNSCFAAGRAERGAPPNVRLLPEIEPVLLHVRRSGQVCLQVLKPVRHYLPDLKLGKDHGKTRLTAFVMLGDSIVGSHSIDVSQLGQVDAEKGGSEMPIPIETSDWYAWMDLMPDATRTLHVQGVVTMPTPGYNVKLAPASPQGINPRILILDLKITPRRGIFPQVVTKIPVRFEQPDAVAYQSVHVRLPDGTAVMLDVEEVR
jgi:hypothetical protein